MTTPSHVRKFLDISTAHITENTAGMLDDSVHQFLGTAPFIAYPLGDAGWLVYVPSEDSPNTNTLAEFHPDLLACMEYARQHNCDYIMFDQDGTVIDDLPAYDW